jgi:HSP20 family protein
MMAKDKEVSVKKAGESVPQRFDQQIEGLFDDFFQRRWPRPFGLDWPSFGARLETQVPRVDVVDKEDHVLVRAELPGMTKDDIEVSVSDSTLTVKGSVHKEEEQDEGEYHRREIVSQVVSRTITLPCEVDGEGAKARLSEGMLEVTIPKAPRSKRTKIEIGS